MCEFFQSSKLLGREELKKSNKGQDTAVLDPVVSLHVCIQA